jgi:hypothetical protein
MLHVTEPLAVVVVSVGVPHLPETGSLVHYKLPFISISSLAVSEGPLAIFLALQETSLVDVTVLVD